MFDWDDLRIFLAVARARRVGAAAKALKLDATTIGRRLQRLSAQLGSELFEQAGGERRLTDRGQLLLAHAETVESAALAAVGEVGGAAAALVGRVRLSVAEGFASFVLAPAVAGFHRACPDIQLDLVTASGFLNPSKREADLAVMLARPRTGRTVVGKLTDYALSLYASRAYPAPLPATVAELRAHPLIGYVPDLLATPELDYLGEVSPALEPGLRSPSINVQHRMIAAGAGLGVLPRFIGDADPSLDRVLDAEVLLQRSFWLVTHSDMRQLARIRAVTHWLREACAGLSRDPPAA